MSRTLHVVPAPAGMSPRCCLTCLCSVLLPKTAPVYANESWKSSKPCLIAFTCCKVRCSSSRRGISHGFYRACTLGSEVAAGDDVHPVVARVAKFPRGDDKQYRRVICAGDVPFVEFL